MPLKMGQARSAETHETSSVGLFLTKQVCYLCNWCRLFADLLVAGQFLYDDLIPALKLSKAMPSLEDEERKALLSFVSHMLTWLPEERKTARELMEHPFLNFRNR